MQVTQGRRLNYVKAAPEVYQALLALQAVVEKSGLEKPLLELIKIRASQINKCAFCLHMHTRDAGEAEERLYLLDAWRDSPLYTDRERAALAWAEALTLQPQTGAPDEAYADVAAHFSEPEVVSLTFAIGAINVWNRFGVSFSLPHPVKAKVVENLSTCRGMAFGRAGRGS